MILSNEKRMSAFTVVTGGPGVFHGFSKYAIVELRFAFPRNILRAFRINAVNSRTDVREGSECGIQKVDYNAG
jgi:hypothetical protein